MLRQWHRLPIVLIVTIPMYTFAQHFRERASLPERNGITGSKGKKKKLPLSDLVHGEADGLHVEPLLPLLPPVLLHQRDHHAAHVVVIVGVLQPQLELRVGPEGVCTSEGFR